MSNNKKLIMTRQRQIILSEINSTTSHPSADEIHARIRKKLPRISLGTVYRNLDILAEHGLIKKLDTGGPKKRYDARTGEHHHVRCQTCGRVDDLSEEPRLKFEKSPEVPGYKLTGYKIEFVGICPDCRKKSREKHEKRKEE